MAEAVAVLGLGFLLGLSLAAPPGPILSLAAQRTVHHGFWPGLIVGVGASVGDATYAVLMGLGAVPLLERVAWLSPALALAGGLLLAWFAYAAWHSARNPPDVTAATADARPDAGRRLLAGGFAAGYAMALSSPFNFGWWIGVGTTLFQDYGAWVFVGFFAGLLAWIFAFTWLVLWMRGRVRGVVVGVSYASAVVLAAFALYFILTAAPELAAHVGFGAR